VVQEKMKRSKAKERQNPGNAGLPISSPLPCLFRHCFLPNKAMIASIEQQLYRLLAVTIGLACVGPHGMKDLRKKIRKNACQTNDSHLSFQCYFSLRSQCFPICPPLKQSRTTSYPMLFYRGM
jgi:hypothetical protein